MNGGRRAVIVGAAGQVGRELQRSFGDFGEVVAADRSVVDLGESQQLRKFLQRVQPDVILNAAAYTAVDRAESERERAMAINAVAPEVLAEEAREGGAVLVHYSTDYVFDGTKQEAWTEDDKTDPLNAYGASKLAGEEAIRRVGGRYLIFRTSWVYGAQGHNFLLTMLRLGREREVLRVVDDQHGAPTTSIALADATRSVVDSVLEGRCGAPEAWPGLYHMSCAGSTSWYGFAQAIFASAGDLLQGRMPVVERIASSEYPTPAKRPRNSVLSNTRLRERFGVELPDWKDALHDVLEQVRAESETPAAKSH